MRRRALTVNDFAGTIPVNPMGAAATRHLGAAPRRALGFGPLTRLTAMLFIICLPFSTIAQFGLLGNFDSNLSLWLFLPLMVMLAAHPLLYRTFLARTPEATILRTFLVIMGLAALSTIFNGMRFDALGFRDYGLDPIRKSIITANVPILIGLLFLCSMTLARGLSQQTLQRSIHIGFWLTVGYTALQAFSLLVPNALYGAIWPFLEGAKDHEGVAYIQRFRRINGPTSEPAELVKLILILYLPWIVLPMSGRISQAKLAAALLITIASQALTGLIILAIVIPILFLSTNVRMATKAFLVSVIFAGVILATAFGDEILGRISARVGNLEDDPSAVIRATYNWAAIEILWENPIFGIGWSNEIFLYPPKISHIAHLWEVQNNIAEGMSLTARSLVLRLAMYIGAPLLMVLIAVIIWGIRSKNAGGAPRDRARTRLTFLILGVGGLVDGGIVTSFYIWVAAALVLGYQMKCRDTALRMPPLP
ncbi:hypothetical protein [Pseudogemmobacter sonorensis]|uniref:hypothetical protein n=1 Tax=Pseudogemmobacter sonorensis TaxID=2989681 RepID=UPI003682AE55